VKPEMLPDELPHCRRRWLPPARRCGRRRRGRPAWLAYLISGRCAVS
jgi:hypothetical protein